MQFSQATQPLTRPMGARLNSPILHLPFPSLKRAKARAPERGIHAASSPMILSDVESLVRAYGVRFLT